MEIKSTIGDIGQIVLTRRLSAAIAADDQASADLERALTAFCAGEWGSIGEDDKAENDRAAAEPGAGRIVAKYPTAAGDIFIITEHDRSATTIMLCDEY